MDKQYRHGDLLLQEVEFLPPGCQVHPGDVVLEGEATGHAHRVSHATILSGAGNLYVQASAHTELTHEEHHRIPLPAGLYRVIRQREYWAGASYHVLD